MLGRGGKERLPCRRPASRKPRDVGHLRRNVLAWPCSWFLEGPSAGKKSKAADKCVRAIRTCHYTGRRWFGFDKRFRVGENGGCPCLPGKLRAVSGLL